MAPHRLKKPLECTKSSSPGGYQNGAADPLLRDLPHVEAGHHHVEQDHVGLFVARLLEPGRAVAGLQHLHLLGLEVDPAEETDRRFVVYDQDFHHRSLITASPAAGRTNPKLEPRSSRGSIQILPRIASSSSLAMKRPRPVPGLASSRPSEPPR